MPKPLGVTFTQVYGSVADELMKRIGDAQAVQAGPPVAQGIEPVDDTMRVDAWNARRPEATDEAMQQLAQQKLQEHLQAGLPADKAIAATAEDLTHFRYGQRLKLYTHGQVDFTDQVSEAKRLKKLAERASTPDPLPAPPTMPSAAVTNAQAVVDPFATPPPAPAAQVAPAAPLAGAPPEAMLPTTTPTGGLNGY